MEFDSKINAYIEANQDHANELFNIARQHRLTYMALNESAMRLYEPVLRWFEEKKLYDDCLKYVYKNIPDCLERALYIHTIMDKEKKNVPTKKIRKR